MAPRSRSRSVRCLSRRVRNGPGTVGRCRCVKYVNAGSCRPRPILRHRLALLSAFPTLSAAVLESGWYASTVEGAVLPSRRFRDHTPTSGIGQANPRPLLCLPIEPAPPGHQISVGHHLLPALDGRLGAAASWRPPAHGTLAPLLGEVLMLGPGSLDLAQQFVIGPTSGQVVTDQRRRSGRKLLAVGTARRPRPIAIKAADSLVQRRELVDDPPDLRAGHLRVLAAESTVAGTPAADGPPVEHPAGVLRRCRRHLRNCWHTHAGLIDQPPGQVAAPHARSRR